MQIKEIQTYFLDIHEECKLFIEELKLTWLISSEFYWVKTHAKLMPILNKILNISHTHCAETDTCMQKL